MAVTFWERLYVTARQAKLGEGGDLAEDRVGPLVLGQCIAAPHVKVRKGGEMPKAFGHHISKIRNTKCEVNRDVLSGSDRRLIELPYALAAERLSEVRDCRSPKPSGIRFPKLENKIITNKATHFQGAM